MFSDLLDMVTFDLVRMGLASYGEVLAHYGGIFRIGVAIWMISIALDALQSDGSFRPTLWRLLRGAVVLAYITEPAVPRMFLELMNAPAHSTGIVLGHVTGNGAREAADFGPAIDQLIDTVGERAGELIKNDDYFNLNIMGYILYTLIYLFLVPFLAAVLYIAALASFFQAALLFVLPFAVALYPWSYTRPLFDGLIRQGLSFSLVMPLLSALLAVVISPLSHALTDVANNLQALVPYFCLCMVGSLMAFQIPAVASGIAGGIGLPILKPR